MKLTAKTIKSFRQFFIDYEDPIGLMFAENHLGGLKNLEKYKKYNWFIKEWDKWQEDLRIIIKSNALKRIKEISEEGSSQSLNAAKYLANGEYLEETKKRGRPTKEEVSGELKRQVKAIEVLNEDYHRMTGFTVVQGGKK